MTEVINSTQYQANIDMSAVTAGMTPKINGDSALLNRVISHEFKDLLTVGAVELDTGFIFRPYEKVVQATIIYSAGFSDGNNITLGFDTTPAYFMATVGNVAGDIIFLPDDVTKGLLWLGENIPTANEEETLKIFVDDATTGTIKIILQTRIY